MSKKQKDNGACPFINVSNCPYTAKTKDGCPYKTMVKAKTITVQKYCPLTK